jgi:hypothetical protein
MKIVSTQFSRATSTGTQTKGASLAVAIDESATPHAHRFVFRALRDTDAASTAAEPRLLTDQRRDPVSAIDHMEEQSSAPFLAGAIAQAHPDPMLHDPPFREAARAYRRSDDLDDDRLRPGLRSDTRV